MSETPDRDGYYIPPEVPPDVRERRWWLHEALRCLHRQGIALRIFQRPAGIDWAEVARLKRALGPELKLLTLPRKLTDDEEWHELTLNRVCEALTELEEAAGIRDLAQESEYIEV